MASRDKLPISALILVRNEEETLKGCLEQLDFVEEIIVLDQKSQDMSVEIAKKFTNKVSSSASDDFSTNRNKLLKLSTQPWVLYLDSDERLSDESVSEISKAISTSSHDAFYFPRKNYVLGRWLKHGGWWPDYVPRLFRKASLIKWHGKVHESPQIKGNFEHFKNPITHLTARNISQMFTKTIKWAKIEAELNYRAKSPSVNILKLISAPVKEFTKRYVIKMGFLDGTVGLTEAVFQGFHTAIVIVYLWEMQNKTEEKYLNADN